MKSLMPLKGDPEKPKDVYKTQAEIDQEDANQVDFAIRHNLVNPLMYHTGKKVGDEKLQYIDIATGKPYDGRYQVMPKSMIKPLPDWVTELKWDHQWNMPYYLDGNDIVYVDKHWYNSPRFITKPQDQQQALAMRNGLMPLK